MPYASCEYCNYKCGLAAELLGKFIRCPKCRSVVEVVAALPSVASPVSNSASAASQESTNLYLGNMIKRRGPLSHQQVQLLAKWNLIDGNELISDESGRNRSTVQEYVARGGWQTALPTARKSRPARLQFAPKEKQRKLPDRNATAYQLDMSSDEALEEGGVMYDEFGRAMMPDEFNALIARAVQMEQQAQTVAMERAETAVEIYVPGPGARLVRSEMFSKTYRAIALVYVINAIICCVFSTATMGMFVKRLLKLSVSVFIPFENTGELIEGEPLLQCGMALVFVCGQFILPIWWLMRQDCVIWHCLAATGLGLLLGMAMKPEWLWFGFGGIRGAAVISGLAVAVLAWQLSNAQFADRVAAQLRIASAITAFLAVLLTLVDVRSIFVADMTNLSPTIQGSGLHVIAFGICFFGVMVAIPLAVGSILYGEAAEVIRNYMMHKVFTVLFLGIVGMASSMCLIYATGIELYQCTHGGVASGLRKYPCDYHGSRIMDSGP